MKRIIEIEKSAGLEPDYESELKKMNPSYKEELINEVVEYLTGEAKAEQTASTDSNGKFTLKAAGGVYLVASASRQVGDTAEKYSWIFQSGQAGSQNILSNDQMLTFDSLNALFVKSGMESIGELSVSDFK